jgi:Putative ATPase subunit of terminase (gpP-like)
MHPQHLRDRARELFRDGWRITHIARELDLHYRTVYDWCAGRMAAGEKIRPHRCFRCPPGTGKPEDPASYMYLLGQYLGDGHVSLTARVPVLRISCADAYPMIMDECEAAMRGSEGVLDICRTALDGLGIEWRMARPDSLSVARRAAVAQLDRWVGPKR